MEEAARTQPPQLAHALEQRLREMCSTLVRRSGAGAPVVITLMYRQLRA
jgi:hypothetical protein